MAFKKRDEESLIQVKVVDQDGSFELIKVSLEEFKEMSVHFFQPKYYYKGGKGYPFPDEENEWESLLGSFLILEV